MRDSDADIAIDVLNKLIDQELKATNVTQRNEVLRELLRWHLEKERLAANRLFDGVTPPRQADVVCGKLRAHTESSNHILSMLGYPDALPPAGRCPDDLSDR